MAVTATAAATVGRGGSTTGRPERVPVVVPMGSRRSSGMWSGEMKKIAEYPCYSHEPSIGNEDLEKERTIDEPTAATVGPAGDVAEGAGTFAVRETRRLYRLKAGRQMAVVAVDTEDE